MPSSGMYAPAEVLCLCCDVLAVHERRCTGLECSLELQASSKYCLAKAPKLVEIMNAVPEEFKSILIPQCAPVQPCAWCSPVFDAASSQLA